MSLVLPGSLGVWWQHWNQVARMRRYGTGGLRELNEHMGLRRLMAMQGFMAPAEADFFSEFLRQRETGVQRIVEIGFNAGHSACMFLSARPDITVVSFDIGASRHVLHAKSFIDEKFPGRHTLIVGDSRFAVPQYVVNAPAADLILVDGGHAEEVARADLRNVRALAEPGKTWVLVDDLAPWLEWGVGPTKAWEQAISNGVVSPEFYLQNGQVTKDRPRTGHDKVCGFGRYLAEEQ